MVALKTIEWTEHDERKTETAIPRTKYEGNERLLLETNCAYRFEY